MTYEVWIQNIERDSDMEKERDYYERDLVTEDSDEARERALRLAERRKAGKVRKGDGEYIVRDEERGISADSVVQPLKQGEVVYSAECLITFPERFDPVYRTVYVVEI